jgi:hypothetical protein
MSEILYDHIVAKHFRDIETKMMRIRRNIPLRKKRMILFNESLNAEMDDASDFISEILWNGGARITGYRNASKAEIEEEWQQMVDGMDDDEILTLLLNYSH